MQSSVGPVRGSIEWRTNMAPEFGERRCARTFAKEALWRARLAAVLLQVSGRRIANLPRARTNAAGFEPSQVMAGHNNNIIPVCGFRGNRALAEGALSCA